MRPSGRSDGYRGRLAACPRPELGAEVGSRGSIGGPIEAVDLSLAEQPDAAPRRWDPKVQGPGQAEKPLDDSSRQRVWVSTATGQVPSPRGLRTFGAALSSGLYDSVAPVSTARPLGVCSSTGWVESAGIELRCLDRTVSGR